MHGLQLMILRLAQPGYEINDRYRLDREIGRGAMGVVFRAYDTLLHREIAIKMLYTTGLGTEGRNHLLQEARAAAGLNHPNIIAIFDAGETKIDGRVLPYIVMEFLEGVTLHEQPPESFAETLAITRQLCSALDHAHQNGMTHRDLKPENVMIAGDGVVKLMDFGLARSITASMTAEGTIKGTLFYMAPETLKGEKIDARADLYALGIMLYEMTTGRLPFDSTDPVAVISQHLHAPVVRPAVHNPELPQNIDQLIVQLLAKEPDKRPSSAAEILSILDRSSQTQEMAVEPQPSTQLDRIVRGRLVGRSTTWSAVRALWNQAVSGEGQVLLISGEAGVGKTRLVHELIALARVSGGQALSGACYAEGGTPYGPFRTILREILSAQAMPLPDQVLIDLLHLLPDIRPIYPNVLSDSVEDHHREQPHLIESVATALRAIGEQRPLLLVLEDLHWADSGTIALLLHLARFGHGQAMLVAVTFRDVEIDRARALHAALLDMRRERLGHHLKLNRLDHAETGTLLATLLDGDVTKEFLDEIYQQTEGNPFFVEEMCKALINSGHLFFAGGRWHHPPLKEVGIPPTIQVAIQRRVQKLSPEAQSIIELAAVMGRDFEFDTLLQAGTVPEDVVIEAIDEALGAQLIEERYDAQPATYAFVHNLIPAAILSGQRTLHFRRLHQRVASVLEKEYPQALERLAYHFIEAGQSKKGMTYLLQAGDSARILYAHSDALTAYNQALELAQNQKDTATSARILLKLGQTYHDALDFESSRHAYDQAFILWQKFQDFATLELPPAAQTLRLLGFKPHNLDPSFGLFGQTKFLFSGLVRLNSEMDIVPDVAHSWQVVNGARKYIFHLRNDVLWSDGQRLTAMDFVLCIKRALDPGMGSWLAGVFNDIKNASQFHQGRLTDTEDLGVLAVDDLTLEIELEQPAGYF
ncbi:MAG: protein kinase, partial [Candidatus Promineifilaceae bacterium]|nr:protein kinase [Candidatus Promineifilaceae bacterium]